MPRTNNLFRLPPLPWPTEVIDTLHTNDGVRIERILSRDHTTPSGKWYDQEDDEWVVLLQGEAAITFANGSTHRLSTGDYLYIAAHERHRVSHTSTDPPCIWLAVHMPASKKEVAD